MVIKKIQIGVPSAKVNMVVIREELMLIGRKGDDTVFCVFINSTFTTMLTLGLGTTDKSTLLRKI